MKRYGAVMADPPWEYKVWSKKGQGRTAEAHYPTMPNLPQAFEVIRAWGFRFKSVAFVWVKTNPKSGTLFWGMGHWTRANAELCLLATRGHPRRVSGAVHQVIMAPVRRHSQKPDEASHRIEQLMGDVSRIELFARDSPLGWDVWGNEVERSIQFNTNMREELL